LRVGADADMLRFYWDKGEAKLQINEVIVRGQFQ
jgi:hypothetical protein